MKLRNRIWYLQKSLSTSYSFYDGESSFLNRGQVSKVSLCLRLFGQSGGSQKLPININTVLTMHFVGPVKPLLRASLRSNPSNGHRVFIPQCRKMIFEYCETWPTSANTRTFIVKHLEDVARKNPHVEIVVKPRPHKEPIVRGLYRM